MRPAIPARLLLLPVLVLVGLWVVPARAQPADRIAFVQVAPAGPRITLISSAGKQRESIRDGIQPAWSPDAARIAFTSTTDSAADVWVMNADGSALRRLTDSPAADFSPAWSPDGAHIAFASDRDGTADIYVMNADGSGVERLTNDPEADLDPSWSPDGRRITFTSAGRAGSSIRSIDTRGERSLTLTTTGTDSAPAWSPDGSLIAFSSVRGGPSEIYVMRPDGSGERRITSLGGADHPSWSPDGLNLVVSRRTEILVISRDGAMIRTLSSGTTDMQPAWGPRSASLPGTYVLGARQSAPAATPRTGRTVALRAAAPILTPSAPAGAAAIEAAPTSVAPARAGPAAKRTRSGFPASVARPGDLRFDPVALAGSALLTGLILLLVFPGALFDNTLSEHYDEVLGWFGRAPTPAGPAPGAGLPWMRLGVAAGGVAFLSGFLDPGFGWDRASAALFVGLVAFFFAALGLDLADMRHLNRRWPGSTTVRVMYAGLLIAAVTVAVSRLIGFQPGYMYGSVAGLATAAAQTRRDKGRRSALALCVLPAGGLVAWMLSIPVGHAAERGHPSLAVLVADAFLAAAFVGGVEGALFSAMPLRWFRGRAVFDYSRRLWLSVAAPVAFVFVHVILARDRGYAGSARLMVTMFAIFAAISVGFWSYFRFRREPVAEATVAQETPTPSRV